MHQDLKRQVRRMVGFGGDSASELNDYSGACLRVQGFRVDELRQFSSCLQILSVKT